MVEVQTIHEAHLKYGPIVRLAPNEISINCVDGGLRTVYAGGFEKPYFYDQFDNYGVPCMFSTKESKPHSIRKRMLSNVYSKTYVQSSKDGFWLFRSILFDRLMPVLESAAKSDSPVDIHELNYATTMDFICCWVFGLGNDSNFIQDVEFRRKYLGWHFKRSDHSFWFAELPSLTSLIQSIGIRLVPKWVDVANDEMQAYLLQLCKRANQSMQTEIDYSEKEYPLQTTRPVVYSQLAESLKASATKPEDGEKNHVPEETEIRIASELLDHVIAGMDTSAITLTYLLWELSKHPDMQVALRKDLRKLSPTLVLENSHNLPSARSVDALPVLQSIIMETLRLHPAIPGPQPRITPPTPTSIAGSPPLPGGVRVSAQAYSLHRNEDVFGKPEVWHPKRWFFAEPERYEEMLRWFWAFGSGGRMCIGKNFAVQELKFVVATIYSNFTTTVVDDAGIEQMDGYTGPPAGNQLKLKFTRLEPEGPQGARLPPVFPPGHIVPGED
ncbi:MAG: hypothetical protein LQ346_007378 [Caloplaca aetnensis]|nr:MAG: hypothetical protein LQ346_007378 [Caloplaca aetnensis]